MTGLIVVLYGSPASGKDTITAELTKAESNFQLFQRLKSGPGRRTGYRMVETADLERLRAAGVLIWENSRYGADYAIDRPGLDDAARSSIPVVHVGQPRAVDALKAAFPERILVVELRYNRSDAAERITARQTGDLEARLAAWDETPLLPDADLRINTSQRTPQQAAAEILVAIQAP